MDATASRAIVLPRLIAVARAAASRAGEPLFYRQCAPALAESQAIFDGNECVQRVLRLLGRESLAVGHGVEHARKVAVEAGAIVISDAAAKDSTEDEVVLAQVAGLLHDVCRGQRDHARSGAQRAQTLLEGFPWSEASRGRIARAIGAHEAFQEKSGAADDSLLANALYDADKFRWGPDNFTTTLWEMLEGKNVTAAALLSRWEHGMEGIRKIRGSFRSATGKDYGPDFIDKGMLIGREIRCFLRAERGG